MYFIIIRVFFFLVLIALSALLCAVLFKSRKAPQRVTAAVLLTVVLLCGAIGIFGSKKMKPRVDSANIEEVWDALEKQSDMYPNACYCTYDTPVYSGNITMSKSPKKKVIDYLVQTNQEAPGFSGKSGEISYYFSPLYADRDAALLGAVQYVGGTVLLVKNDKEYIEIEYAYRHGALASYLYAIAPIELFHRPTVVLSDILKEDLTFNEANALEYTPNDVIVFP